MDNLNKLDIITLDDGEWTILEILPEDEKEYFYLVKTSEDDEFSEDIKIVYKAQNSQGDIGFAEVTDAEEFENVAEIFSGMLEIDYPEN